MAVGVAEVGEGKGPQAVSRPARQKESTTSQPATPQARFFLAKGAGGGTPEFGRECATEAEAIAESYKAGVSYYAVIEYRTLLDCSGKQPLFRKEAVKKNP